MSRVLAGWKAACHPETGLIPQLKSLKELENVITKGGVPSWLLSVPDPNLAVDVYQGVVNAAYSTGELSEADFAYYTTETGESIKEKKDTTTGETTYEKKTSIKVGAGLDNAGLATTLMGGKMGKKGAELLGKMADCGTACATTLLTSGFTAGAAVAGCGKFVAGGIKYAMEKYIANNEHKATRVPCDELKSELYHTTATSGRAMDLLTMLHAEKQELHNFGLEKGAIEQGMVIFSQMQCMTNVALSYVKMPGELLGVQSDAAKLTCSGGGSDLDKDEKYAEEALRQMSDKYATWKQESGVAAAIRKKKKAAEKAVVEQAEEARTSQQQAVLDEILANTQKILAK